MTTLTSQCQNPKAPDLCRLCLEKSSSLISLFDYEPLENPLHCPLLSKISLCLSVRITHEDKITTKVCQSCAVKVDEFYNFYNKATQSQKLLAQWEFELEVQRTSESTVKNDFNSVLDGSSEILDGALSLQEEEEGKENNFRKHHDLLKVVDGDSLSATFDDVDATTSGTGLDTDYLNIDQLGLLSQEKGAEQFDLKVSEDKTKGSNSLTCGDCDIEFKTALLLKKHVKEKHSSYVCSCGARFTCLRYLARHEARHNAKPTIPCKLCNKMFINNSELKEHQKSHQVGEKISCELCDYVTLYKSNMSRHLKRHNKDYLLFCDICNEGCYSKDELVTHHIKKHGAAPFYCKTCNKNFTNRGYLYNHNKTTHCITSKDYLCETCGKAFKTKNATKRHMKIHLGLKFSCQICSKTMNSSYSLKKHLKAHRGEKDVICYICGKAFVDKKYMAAHLRSHTGERPYCCNECGKRFTQATTLKVHMRYHTGERPYVCQLCGSGFVTKTLLTAHMKNHEKGIGNNS
ncbi:zinc finger protein OZF-like isoform X1 [Cimex lectularius]|uniref:Zinc finger protein n=1 Tax=Cimex lectularius TaxID=79782 RepID=A0A8I6SS89_CIMLE|nr:zinc finger protein OZF-like isoform X1 [Cimex lectularius]